MKDAKTVDEVYIDYFIKSGNYRPAEGGVRKSCANCLYFYKSGEECACDLVANAIESDDPTGTGSPNCVCDFHRPFTKPLKKGESEYQEDSE